MLVARLGRIGENSGFSRHMYEDHVIESFGWLFNHLLKSVKLGSHVVSLCCLLTFTINIIPNREIITVNGFLKIDP